MTRVLLTGGAGGVGKELASVLMEHGYAVRIFDLPFMDFSAFEGVDNVEVLKGDIGDVPTVHAALEGVETVVHLAALLPPNSERNRDKTMAVNVQGTKNLLAAIHAAGGKARLILTSSVATYGDTTRSDPPIRSSHPQKPMDIYGESKVAAEKAILESAVPYTILRVSGISVPALLDPPDTWPFQPDQRMEFINRADVIGALVAAVESRAAVDRVFNIAGGKSWQMLGHEYAEALCRLLDVPVEKTHFPKTPGWCDWYDTDESQATLGYQRTSFAQFLELLDQAIQEMLA